MVVISLTDREQTLLSDSVLTMIENAVQAQRLVCDTETAATAPAYELTKPYIFPAVDGNMAYHTSWGSHGVKNEAETILSVLNSFRLRSTLAIQKIMVYTFLRT